jgi:ribosomal protein S18 acetylase RimI-like enzyme
MNDTCIRSLNVGDYDAMIALWQRSGLSSLRLRGRDSREAFAAILNSPRCNKDRAAALGFEKNSCLVGVIIVTHDGRKGWINRLAVDPAHRRRGYARALIAAAEAKLQAQGIKVIAALVERENADSLGLFQSAGYGLDDRICYLSKRESTEA